MNRDMEEKGIVARDFLTPETRRREAPPIVARSTIAGQNPFLLHAAVHSTSD